MTSLETIIFTGVSGAGKTTALRAVEDLGYYCVDNLPLPLLGYFVETMKTESAVGKAALVVDARLGRDLDGYALAFLALKSSGYIMDVVYLDAGDEALVRRFSQTRRRHPLGGPDLRDGLQQERQLLAPLRGQAGICLDTSELTPHELKQIIQDRYEDAGAGLVVLLLSFGFRYGLPSHADVVFDVRFLSNPFFVDELRRHSGREPKVSDYVIRTEDGRAFLDHAGRMLEFLLPRFEDEGKVYLTVAVGCTGGRHRSVAIVEELGRRLGSSRAVKVRHRDVDR